MVKTIVEYQGDLHCRATHVPSGATIETDAPKDNHGKGECFSPTDLVAAALGSCTVTILGILGRRKGWDLTGLRVEVEKMMSSEPPRRIVSLPIVIWMPIYLEHQDRVAVEKAAFTCPVHHGLHPDIEIPIVIHWPEEHS